MTVVYSVPTIEDRQSLTKAGLDGSVLDERIKATFTDAEGHSGELFLEKEKHERLGEKYIAENSSLEYSKFLETWMVCVSENAYYNDPVRYPPLAITLRYISKRESDGAEVYKRTDVAKGAKRYCVRYVSNRENFARWCISSGYKNSEFDSRCRSNITFVCREQCETVRYDDWNDVAAYSDTFNPDFCPTKK